MGAKGDEELTNEGNTNDKESSSSSSGSTSTHGSHQHSIKDDDYEKESQAQVSTAPQESNEATTTTAKTALDAKNNTPTGKQSQSQADPEHAATACTASPLPPVKVSEVDVDIDVDISEKFNDTKTCHDQDASVTRERGTQIETASKESCIDMDIPPNTKTTTEPPPLILPLIRQQPSTAKVKIHLIAVGSAPLLKKAKFLLAATSPFGTLQSRLRKMLQLGENDSLYLYVQQSFVPCEEDWIGDLSDLYSTRGELQIHYSLQEAWG